MPVMPNSGSPVEERTSPECRSISTSRSRPRATSEAWLQIDFPASHTITRLVVELGAHFGEFLRQWRVDTSLDGVTWTPATTERNGVPPLVGLVRDPSHLAQELRLTTPTLARHLRIVRPATDNQLATVDVWLNWTRWGVHELRVFEAPP